MDSLVISTPARLHFGLIDMNGQIGRIDGGVGLALDSPHTLIEAKKEDDIKVECKDDPEMIDRIEVALKEVREYYDLGGIDLNVRARPLPHVGLGSATQTLVGAAHAFCMLYGLDKSSPELASLVGRGGTSGIGVEAIRSGGFIIDAGHHFRRGENSKSEYMPSGASSGIQPPPVLARYDFPGWDILVVVPLGEGTSGLREVTLFKVVCPIPLEQVQKMCHILLMQMMPAVIEKDLEMFGKAMEDFQQIGFKVFEYRAQTKLLHDCLRFLKDNDAIGAGMSSWGPALYAFGQDLSELKQKAKAWLASHGGGEVILTKANNHGMQIKEER